MFGQIAIRNWNKVLLLYFRFASYRYEFLAQFKYKTEYFAKPFKLVSIDMKTAFNTYKLSEIVKINLNPKGIARISRTWRFLCALRGRNIYLLTIT